MLSLSLFIYIYVGYLTGPSDRGSDYCSSALSSSNELSRSKQVGYGALTIKIMEQHFLVLCFGAFVAGNPKPHPENNLVLSRSRSGLPAKSNGLLGNFLKLRLNFLGK